MVPRSNGCSDPMRLQQRGGTGSREPGRERRGEGMASDVQNVLQSCKAANPSFPMWMGVMKGGAEGRCQVGRSEE